MTAHEHDATCRCGKRSRPFRPMEWVAIAVFVFAMAIACFIVVGDPSIAPAERLEARDYVDALVVSVVVTAAIAVANRARRRRAARLPPARTRRDSNGRGASGST